MSLRTRKTSLTCSRVIHGWFTGVSLLLTDPSRAVGSCKRRQQSNIIDTQSPGTQPVERRNCSDLSIIKMHLSSASRELWQKLTQVKYVLLQVKLVHWNGQILRGLWFAGCVYIYIYICIMYTYTCMIQWTSLLINYTTTFSWGHTPPQDIKSPLLSALGHHVAGNGRMNQRNNLRSFSDCCPHIVIDHSMCCIVLSPPVCTVLGDARVASVGKSYSGVY